MEIQEILRNLGFQEYETRILLCLFSKGTEADAKLISENSSVPLGRIYSILIKLEKQGLIKKIPGKRQLFSAVEKPLFLKILEQKKQEKINQEKENAKNLISQLNTKISEIQKGAPTEFSIRYFTDPEIYWKVYSEEISKLKKEDMHYVINNVRLTFSFLPEELNNIPSYQKLVKNELLRCPNYVIHYLLNPESIVDHTIKDLKTKEKIAKSLNQMLDYMLKYKKYFMIDITPALKNILVDIQNESVFLEFPGENSAKISSAIQIKNNKVANDFVKWFNAFCYKKHNPTNDFEKFKSEIQKYAKQKGIVLK